MSLLTKRLYNLTPSPTFEIDAKVKELQLRKIKVINLGIGEPDFETPANVKKAGVKAISGGFTHYTNSSGILELRNAVSKKIFSETNVSYDPSEIIVGSGVKPLLYFALQVLCQEGDEVLVPVPTWSTYVEQVKLSGATPIAINLKPPFKMKAEDVEKKITKKTKSIILNTPANPTGAIIEKEELIKIANLIFKNHVWVIADEIYEKIVFNKNFFPFLSVNRKLKEHVIYFNGFSKTFAMTGWRLGYAAGPAEIIKAMGDLQSQITSNACSISQKAGLEALGGSEKDVIKMVLEFKKRRDFLTRELEKIHEISFASAEGSFYFFVDIRKLIGKKFKTSKEWCQELLLQKKVALVPGEAFLYPGYFRLSFVLPTEDLKIAVTKIKDFINENK